MPEYKNADWTAKELAEANYNMNKGYFEDGSYKTYPSYYKIKEGLNYILKNEEKKNLTLLDYGCGCAFYGKYIKLEGFNITYVGADISPGMIEFAKKVCDAEYIIANSNTTYFDQAYDIVFSGAVLELAGDWNSSLRNMARSAGSWLFLHRLFLDKHTRTEQTTTYNNIPDIRVHIGVDDLNQILWEEGFVVKNFDIWNKCNSYKQGTVIAKREGGCIAQRLLSV